MKYMNTFSSKILLLFISILILTGCAMRGRIMQKNQISTLGSLHGYMLKNTKYTLGNFISAIYAYKPDVILTEVLPSAPGPLDGSIDGGIEQSVVYAVAASLSIEVIPVDWFDDSLIEEMSKEESKLTSEAKKEIEPYWMKYTQDFAQLSLLELNSQDTQNLVEKIYDLYEKHGLTTSRKRNDRILENIQIALKNISNKRILIIYGLDHKYFLDRELKKSTELSVIEVTSWATPESVKWKGFLNPNLKKEIIENLQNSKKLLQERLKSKFYSVEMSQRLGAKLKNFESWETFVNDL